MRLGRTVLTYGGCLRWSVAAAVAAAGLLAGGGLADVLLPATAAAVLIALVWAGFTLRVIRLASACPDPGGPGPGGAGVREPRRPGPCPPGGAIALPLPEDPPGGAAALA
ncbi:hypothetical protein [Streptomyces anthocyanicus]|uniref:hypothetical protein n=1 Tax=Streptomyces anthocyanicus TaxID=68174 RepID=UPI003369CA8C